LSLRTLRPLRFIHLHPFDVSSSMFDVLSALSGSYILFPSTFNVRPSEALSVAILSNPIPY
ncbi:MAG: hypothetical protein ACON39_03930, partial [Coraliomargaritaceae bacterium]